jgi:hypothetical protein
MLIFDSNSKPIILDSIHVPTLTDHFWVLDLTMMDFTLAPLISLEEVVCPTLILRVKGFDFALPANWNVLVYDRETSQLDVVELAETCGREFTALCYGPTKSRHTPAIVSAVDYHVEQKNVGPLLGKHQMLCHPIGPDEWINVAPSDTFNKYLKDRAVGDLISD